MSEYKLTTATQGFDALQSGAGRVAKQAQDFNRIVRALSKPDGFRNLKRLEHNLEKLKTLDLEPGNLQEAAATAMMDAQIWLDGEWQRRAVEFAAELQEFLRERSISALANGDAVTAPPFVVQLDARRDRAQLMYAGEPLGKSQPLSASLIYRVYTSSITYLEQRQTPPEVFADDLIDAYRDACRRNDVREGARVRLPDVHFMLFFRRQTSQVKCDPRNGRIKEYPRYQFAWDIGLIHTHNEWLERGGAKIVLHPASATSSRSRSDSLRVVETDGNEVIFGDMHVAKS